MEKSNLKVLKIKDPEKLIIKPFPEVLPNPYNSLLLVIGAVKSGKSTLLSNLFLNPIFYGSDFFDKVMVISNSILNDPNMRFMKDTFEYKSEYTDGDIKQIIASQKKYGSKENMPLMALIADDILSTGFKKNNELSFLASRFRHYNIFYTITTQNFRALSPIIRSNATSVIVTLQSNANEKSKIVDEYAPMYNGEKKFLELYDQAINYEPYSFLYLKLDENPAQAYISFIKRIM